MGKNEAQYTRMHLKLFVLVCSLILYRETIHGKPFPWQMQKAPIMTRWAKDVKPDRAHPEYPRPQMVRKDWLNLNGLWEFAAAKENEPPPVVKDLTEKILVPFPVESA